MIHFGLICPAISSHLYPMAALGRELLIRGYQVTLFDIPDSLSRVQSEGLNFCPIGESEYPLGWAPKFLKQVSELSGTEASICTQKAMGKHAGMVCKELPDALRVAGVTALIVDQFEPAGAAVAEHLKLPFISLCSAVAFNLVGEKDLPAFFTSKLPRSSWRSRIMNQLDAQIWEIASSPTLKAINKHRHRWGLAHYKRFDDSFSPLAQISQQAAAFDFPRINLPKNFHFTGPIRNQSPLSVAFPYEKLTGQPLIYASMGTFQSRHLGIFHTIAEACVNLDCQLILSLGGRTSTHEMPSLPGTPLVVDYAPQDDLLSRAKLCITHAGMNTALESLTHGVPMIAIPITNDQPGVAARIAYTETGEVIPLPKLNTSDLRKAIERVLTENSYQQAALKMKEHIQQSGGVTRAADIVETAISSKKPVAQRIRG
jgi:zeaxanthin glucosyltransferase